MRSRGALLGLASAVRQRRGCPRLRPCSTPASGHSLVSLRSASTQAPSADAAPKTYAHRPLQLNLGNNITVDLPASFAFTGHPRGRKSRRRHAPKDAAQRASLSSSSDKTMAIHTVVEESAALETAESTTTVEASANNFTIPRGGTAAAALLQCDTLVEALATPVSVAPFSLPLSAATTSPAGVAAAQTRVAAAQATFTTLQTTALPLLFHFAAQQRLQQQQQPDYKDSSVAAPHTSSGSVVSADRVAEALQTLHTHLENIAAAFHCDGRRHVSALPPPVVAALWEEVMPFLHQAALPQQNNAAHVADDRFTSPPPVSAVVPSQLKASYVAVRRALALHTRAVAPLLPPDALAVVLTRIFQCGALADDILGSIVTAAVEKQRAQSSGRTASPSAASTVGGTILILQQRVLRQSGPVGAASDDAPAAFRGATAITMARLLGKAATPGHHQLHSFFHHALLPEVVEVLRSTAAAAPDAIAVREGEAGEGGSTVGESSAHESTCGKADVVAAAATPPLPGTDALLDLTSAFRHYAVSGDAVQHLTTLWQAHFTIAAEAVTWRDCAALLRALSRLPIASSRSQRRQARQLARGSSGARPEKLLRSMVEEDYYPLVEVVCAQMRRLSEAMVAAAAAAGQSPAVGAVATARLTAGLDVPPSELLGLLRMLLRVNSPHWAETYDALATAVFVRLATPQLSAEGSSSTNLMNALSASEAQRTVMALLHRNSLIPDHPLHRVLLRRLLHAPEALTDPAVAAAALLGLEVMVPGDEGVVSEDAGQQHTPDSAASTPESTAMAVAAPADSDLVVTAEDRACALRLLRRHGRSMSPTAFVAGLCVAPIHQLPLSTQTALVNHLTSVASAVPPVYLVKGMAAVVQSLHPSAVDDVSVRQWYSRFTARDVVRQVDAAGCAVLLDVLSANPRFEQHCVVAKQAITRRIGAALLHAGDDDEGGAGAEGGRLPTAASAGGLTLEQLPLVVSALRRGRVFLPPYFSRVCRLLLSQVETAALGDLLSPFSATAEEFMRRQQREGQASVFKDVWELLRGRVLEQVATLALTDTCTALNAFAALDVCDRPLFGVLVHHLWRCVQEAGLTATQPGDAGSDGTVREVEVGSGESDGAAGQGESEEAEEAAVRRLAQVGEHITRALTPSAIAVVVTNLCAREDALQQQQQQQRGHHQDSAAALHRRSDTMLPWMLLALRDHHTELYPIDVVHLLPTLLQRYTAAAAVNGPLLPLLHAAYDACRTTFLHMYAVLPETTAVLPETTTTASAAASPAPAPESGVEGSTLTAEETRRIAAQRAAWTPAVQLSVRVVPRTWFAPILLRLSSAEVADVDVGLACVERVCTRRVCGMQLPVDQLVDVCLTMCWMFRMTDFDLDSSSSSSSSTSTKDMPAETAQACDEANVMAAGGAKAVLRPAMAVVLSALWYRCDELSAAHINAVLRCLADTYGADRVDDDFVQRLKAQKTLIDARQKKAAATAAGEAETQSTAGAAAPPFPAPSAAEEMQAEDLFSMM